MNIVKDEKQCLIRFTFEPTERKLADEFKYSTEVPVGCWALLLRYPNGIARLVLCEKLENEDFVIYEDTTCPHCIAEFLQINTMLLGES